MGTAIPDWLDAGAGAATCNLLTAGSGLAASFAARSAMTAQLWPALGGAAVSAAFAGAAYALNCFHNPGMPESGGNIQGSLCPTGTGNQTDIEYLNNSGVWSGTQVKGLPIKAIVSVNPTGTGSYYARYTRWDMAGEFGTGNYPGSKFRTVVKACGVPVETPEPPVTVYDYDYTDASTNCVYRYSLKDAWVGADGYPRLKWEVNGATPARTGSCQGGRITGYVWAPSTTNRYVYNPEFNYDDGGGNGGGPIDFRPDLGELFNFVQRIMAYNDPGDLYRLVSVCETDAGGEPISEAVEVNIPPGIRDAGASTRVRLEAITKLLQGLKDFRQPICPPERPKLTGEWVSVHFVSDENSPGGDRPLRKRFRYRDQNFAPLEDHIAHWEGFQWDAGPVIVVSKNLSWGVPKVWAASAAEGKRVIAHAAAIAGVDLSDPVHEWVVTGTADPRYGRTGRMRVDTRGGEFVRITKRPSPSGLPTGARPHS